MVSFSLIHEVFKYLRRSVIKVHVLVFVDQSLSAPSTFGKKGANWCHFCTFMRSPSTFDVWQ